ncbi:purine-nucleoside phosphorylase [Eubacteriales bacterium OttesenSCG-928-M02]|nr:purine-nucleoside phosphorylase [Eubacteriales bacterium OttesenSCG-928-M02]
MYFEMAKEAANYITAQITEQPKALLVLGSGLGDYALRMENPTIIPYTSIPHFKQSTVPGHEGQLVLGRIFDVPVAIMQGRVHYYEGYSQQEITLPVRTLRLCGAEILFLTNAAGGINLDFSPGDLMLIDDHINFSGQSPLMGPNEEQLGLRFPDMAQAYDKQLKQALFDAAARADVELKRGVYMMFSGPQFETGAEIRFARTIGADAAGMSTVPEVIAGRHAGMRICGVSCITNMAAGILDQPLSHEEVNETALQVQDDFKRLVDEFIKGIAAL